MKKLIAFTFILVAAIVLMTMLYFKNLALPGRNPVTVMKAIPANASLIFEFTNDDNFYDVYDSSALFTSIAGKDQLHDLQVLHQELRKVPLLKSYLDNQLVYISVHPKGNLLLTFSTTTSLSLQALSEALRQSKSPIQLTPIKTGKLSGVSIKLPALDHAFEILNRGNNIYSGSFSPELVAALGTNEEGKENQAIMPVSSQQQSNALANLYISYNGLDSLFDHWFKTSNTDYFKPLRLLPATAALTLNFKSDALMFSGYTNLDANAPVTYLSLFKNQQPYVNQLKNVFPGITAFSTCFAVSDPLLFQHDLEAWQLKAGLGKARTSLFKKIKAETGVQFDTEFKPLLSNEFAIITTRFDDKLAIIQLKNGSKLQPALTNISTMNTDNTGRLNYSKLPFLLLGDAFTMFKQPYFAIIDNYLVLANTATALTNYQQIYQQQTFLAKIERYNEFDNLLAERSNISFFVNFKNASTILRHNLKQAAYQNIYFKDKSITTYYAGSYQLSSNDKHFYTNFCMEINKPDSLLIN